MLSASREMAVRVGERDNRESGSGSDQHADRLRRKRDPTNSRQECWRNEMIPSGAAELRVALVGEATSQTVRKLLEKGYSVTCLNDSEVTTTADAAVVVNASQLDGEALPELVERLDKLRDERGLKAGGAWKPWFP